jgi:hypothetical protein
MSNFLIQIIPTLNSNDLESVNQFCESGEIPLQENTVFSGTGFRTDTTIRSSTGFTLPEGHPVTDKIGKAMNEALLVYRDRLGEIHPSLVNHTLAPGAWGTSSHREGIQILEYQPGQMYNFHYDQNWCRTQQTFYRTISVVLYLNSDFEGGGTEFADQVYKPCAGEALIFPSSWCFPHCGQKVISGVKRVAVTWYYVYPTPQSAG